MRKLISGMSLVLGMLTSLVADEAATKPKPDVSVKFCGKLRHGVMAIGGESTGTNISFDRVIWELKLHNDADRKFAQQHHKKMVVVTGSLRKVDGIETRDRWIIDVKKLTKQDVKKDKEGVRMTIVGKLHAADTRSAKPSMTVDSAGQVWPVKLCPNANLKTMSASLIDQNVLLTGTIKRDPTRDFKTQPTIEVTALKRPPTPPKVR